MSAKKLITYTSKDIVFSNWKEKDGLFCPTCGRGYITIVETPKASIYVHSGQHLCEVRKND